MHRANMDTQTPASKTSCIGSHSAWVKTPILHVQACAINTVSIDYLFSEVGPRFLLKCEGNVTHQGGYCQPQNFLRLN